MTFKPLQGALSHLMSSTSPKITDNFSLHRQQFLQFCLDEKMVVVLCFLLLHAKTGTQYNYHLSVEQVVDVLCFCLTKSAKIAKYFLKRWQLYYNACSLYREQASQYNYHLFKKFLAILALFTLQKHSISTTYSTERWQLYYVPVFE